jgi:ornithine cyclodeaminase
MALPDASVVGLIGTGRQAITQLEAVCAVRPITRVKAFSRNAENRQKFAAQMTQSLGIDVVAVDSAQECVSGSQIVVAITKSSVPVFDGAWLDPGTHVNAAGANSWTRCEVDDTTIERSAPVVVDNLDQAKMECGELIAAVERGAFRWRDAVELHQVVDGSVPGRPTADAITLFESQGIGIEDVACYAHVLRQAKEQGVGQELPF